ncbi:MAG TPA: aspartate carbamoyltransferase [Candidatus Atribacteria bacterium]|jgi:aspartate carbamoyltransferase catalytic subunit|nr:aspartate carbamoyltransferase [Candidatus Atribacteria bacterium]
MIKGRNLIEANDFSLAEIDDLLKFAGKIITREKDYSDLCKGNLIATLFYEPSTRTKFSFESAILRLGGQVIGFADAMTSSVSKGESLIDTIQTISCYADLIIMRHPKEGAPKLASKYSKVPIINGGDGSHQHPTQTLTDLLTIHQLKGTISNFTVGLCGDLKFGRTTHSLTKILLQYPGINFVFISPEELRIPDYIKEEIGNNRFQETYSLENSIDKLDILYMTRIQKERFFSEEEYLRLKDSYILDNSIMKKAKNDMIVMHPLPRVNEIAAEVDQDERAVYFKQAKYGMYIRMALISKILGKGDKL